MNLWCDRCGQPCAAVLHEVGPVPECCGERGVLSVMDDGDETAQPSLRPLTPFEEQELLRDLYAELEQSETPHQRAYRRSMDRS